MIRPAWLVVGALAAVACGNGKSPQVATLSNTAPAPPPPDAAPPRTADHPMAMMRRFTEEMCTCVDTQCAQAVSDRMTAWAQKLASEETEPAKMTEEEQRQAVEIGTRMGECMQRAMTGSGGP